MAEVVFEGYKNLELFSRCASTYKPPLFFSRYRRAFLPPYYSDVAEGISRKTKMDFTQLWGWECERLMKSLGIPEVGIEK